MKSDRFRITVLIGTRPEAIKMAPVIRALQNLCEYETCVLLSGQQTEMSIAALQCFGLQPDCMLACHPCDFSLSSQASTYLGALNAHLSHSGADLMLVHGDTTTGFIGALAAFYRGIPAGHVEAGLRSYDLKNPFPEEANRRLIDAICRLHFAPTVRARHNLIKENTDPHSIVVTGNTVVDAVQQLCRNNPDPNLHCALPGTAKNGQRTILLTAHRRENWGAPLKEICCAVRTLADSYPDVTFIVPVHPNPNVSEILNTALIDHPRIRLTPPLSYTELIAVMRAAYLILTDSGGIQEEAPSVGTPVLILRKVTERPEIVEGGSGRLVGTRREDILAHTCSLLENPTLRDSMRLARNPFGDGRASDRIVRAIDNFRNGLPLTRQNDDFHWEQFTAAIAGSP
jgi:UDP-N-acetylglucosamine 2-epimerase (non-hydrolysing)